MKKSNSILRRNIVNKIRILNKCLCHSLLTDIITMTIVLLAIAAVFYALCFGIGVGYEFAFAKYGGVNYDIFTADFLYENGTIFNEKICITPDLCHPVQGYCYLDATAIFFGCIMQTTIVLIILVIIFEIIFFACYIVFFIISKTYIGWIEASKKVALEDKELESKI